MQHGQNSGMVLANRIGHDVGQDGNNQFAGSFNPARSAGIGMMNQHFHMLADGLRHVVRGGGIVLCDVILYSRG